MISNLFGFGFVALSWVAVILIYETSENLIMEPTWLSAPSSSSCWSGLPLPGHPVEAGAPAEERMELHRACGAIGSRLQEVRH